MFYLLALNYRMFLMVSGQVAPQEHMAGQLEHPSREHLTRCWAHAGGADGTCSILLKDQGNEGMNIRAFQLFCCLRWCHCCDPYPEDARPIECSTLLGRHVKLFKVYTRKANWSAWPCQHWLWIDIPWIDIPIHPPGTFFGLKPEAGLNVSGSRWISQRCGHSFLGDGLYWNQHMAHSCVSIRINSHHGYLCF